MITAIGDVLRRCYERGWITSRDGNCSLRRARSVSLYVTPSGWRKTIVHPEHMVKIKFVDGKMQVPPGTNDRLKCNCPPAAPKSRAVARQAIDAIRSKSP